MWELMCRLSSNAWQQALYCYIGLHRVLTEHVTVLIGFQWVSAFGHLGVRVKRFQALRLRALRLSIESD